MRGQRGNSRIISGSSQEGILYGSIIRMVIIIGIIVYKL